MSKSESTTELNNFKPFDQISDSSNSLLSRGLRYTDYNKTTGILRKGQKVSGAYVVVAGQLRVFTLTPKGNEATLYNINPGETCVLALNCIFNDLLYPAWVEATPNTKVATIDGKSYKFLFEAEAAIRDMTVQSFSTLVFRLMAELEEIHSCKLEQRLANLLLNFASSDGMVRMTQQEIASHLGTSREVIARVLRQFVAEKYIDTKRSMILIDNPLKLASLVKPM